MLIFLAIINVFLTGIVAYGVFIAVIMPYQRTEREKMGKTTFWLEKIINKKND